MGRDDYKAILTEIFNDGLPSHLRVVIFTNFAEIEANVVNHLASVPDQSHHQGILLQAIHDANDRTNDITSREGDVINTSILMLEKVSITPHGSNTSRKVDDMIIFTDQIVGLSLR